MVAVVLGLLGLATAGLTARAVLVEGTKPSAIVALGDSAISGEGAGEYEAGTDVAGNFCHRSAGALIHRTGLDVDLSVNLACSGAKTANVVRGGEPRFGEAPQVERLAELARDYDVEVVVLQVGANDEIDFSGTVVGCIVRFTLPFLAGCRDTIGPDWADRVAVAAARVELVVADLRAAMADAGYDQGDYDLVLQSYASPVTEAVASSSWWGRLTDGCPFQRGDLAWGRTMAVPGIAAGMAATAERTGTRFLDLARATEGREACSGAVQADERWVVPVDIEIDQLRNGFGTNVVQESFHPNAAGHAAIGACLGQFVRSGMVTGACLLGPDGQLHPVDPQTAAATAPDPAAAVAAAAAVDEAQRDVDARDAIDALEPPEGGSSGDGRG